MKQQPNNADSRRAEVYAKDPRERRAPIRQSRRRRSACPRRTASSVVAKRLEKLKKSEAGRVGLPGPARSRDGGRATSRGVSSAGGSLSLKEESRGDAGVGGARGRLPTPGSVPRRRSPPRPTATRRLPGTGGRCRPRAPAPGPPRRGPARSGRWAGRCRPAARKGDAVKCRQSARLTRFTYLVETEMAAVLLLDVEKVGVRF